MTSAHRSPEDDLAAGAPGWSALDGGLAGLPRLEPEPAADAIFDAGTEDLDLDADARGDGLAHSPVFTHRRRAHVTSALGAGAAVAVVLVAHTMIDGPSFERGGPAAAVGGRVIHTAPISRVAKFPARVAATHHRPARSPRVSTAPDRDAPRLSVARVVVASAAAANPVETPRAAEFGFEP
jgi:hypothetical protein